MRPRVVSEGLTLDLDAVQGVRLETGHVLVMTHIQHRIDFEDQDQARLTYESIVAEWRRLSRPALRMTAATTVVSIAANLLTSRLLRKLAR